MENKKEMTAPCVSVGADTEQSFQKCSNDIIPRNAENINSFEEMQRELRKMLDPSYLKTMSMTELYDTVFQSRPPLIDGLLYPGTYLFVGAPKLGKSFLMAQLAYHISTGMPLWNYTVRKGTVLYLALEDDYRRLQERLYRMFGTDGAENLFFSVSAGQLGNGLDEQLTRFMQELFFSNFDARLYGHERFKEEFKELVTSFRVFNKLGEHKILSLFLMGDSGVGKTEVARSIHKALGSQAKLAKINFGNYSSHDALNSLIGSPLGYIGSDGGELLKRVNESDVGLILIDEFEKADNAVFNYFLDVLENGKIVNSQADEYDVNGYIIVFTSNITKENFKSKISPELRSRFDYKGVFNLLTDEDKKKFVHFRVNQIITKYREFVSTDIPDKLHDIIVSKIDVSQFKNMRDLNKKIKDTFVAHIK